MVILSRNVLFFWPYTLLQEQEAVLSKGTTSEGIINETQEGTLNILLNLTRQINSLEQSRDGWRYLWIILSEI